MIKYILRIVAVLLLITNVDVVSAQTVDSGKWTYYPVFSSGNKRVIDTGKIVYFANTGLFSYNKETAEQYSYTVNNLLSDYIVSDIFYNYEKKYLFIAYDNGNIDLLYENGSIANIPDISYSGQSPCTINNVLFDGDIIYVSTAFGLVKINEPRREVIESGIFNKAVYAMTFMDDYLLINFDSYLYYIERGKSIHSISDFTKFFYIANNNLEMEALSDNVLIIRGNTNNSYALKKYNLDIPTNVLTKDIVLSSKKVQPFIHVDNKTFVVKNGAVYGFDDDFNEVKAVDIPEAYKEDVLETTDMTDFWCINDNGVMSVRFNDDGSSTVLSERFVSQSTFTRDVCFIRPAPSGREFYLQNLGATGFKFVPRVIFTPLTATKVNVEKETFTNVTPYPVEANAAPAKSNQNNYGKYPLGPVMLTVSPDEEDTYYLATGNDGIFKVTGGELAGVFTSENTPLTSYYGINTFSSFIDKAGNMWVVSYGGSVSILPADKRRLNPSEVKKDDWIIVPIDGFSGNTDVTFLECEKSGMIFFMCHSSSLCLVAYDTNNTPSDFSDDTYRLWNAITDQDGKVTNVTRNSCLAEDKNGRVWLGTSDGIFIINNPQKAIEPDMTVTHVKVPRNDGTNEADYLLGSDLAYCIAVDNLNRKWIASDKSGLLCVNANGNTILQSFTVDNSPLPSNTVSSVWADPMSNDIYVGTLYGLFKYDASEESPAENYDNIYAYPNPVRHDYYGTINIKGLMDNSLVKIADSAGNVVAQGRAENGLFQWNGCNSTGAKVKTGVYFVFVSQNTNGSSAAVTKIMVIN